ncbi:type VII secretion-associated serine protease mycosin [Amycolatopsis acidicola]|uniref:Type VII secretion-associated serine protease mycosin n=1 Tax=Amycolatopsis acidicola TaxID=2596893 RepID=A0A5N0VBF0_9PSEU|nr:type VII secretion-associated serine protease mycosin [Amycolatopsis acidicola]KAA9162888.1 type VII secretion-associated serine protease mycosin [Amycolatopsis acidicola]
MRTLGVPGRSAAVLLAGTIGVLVPLVPALAQTSSDGGYWATPPPAVQGAQPDDGGGHSGIPYTKTKDCVSRDLNNNIVLREKPWGQQYLQIEEAQQLAIAKTGSAGGGQKVAVIDTGVTQHPYFKYPIVSGGDYVDPADGGLLDCDGHGTEVAGIIAANTPASIGFKGVAPDAQIVSIRQSSQNYELKSQTSSAQAPPASSSANPPAGGGGETSGQQTGDDTGSREQGQGAGNTHTLAQAVVRAANLHVGVINMSVDNCRTADGTINSGERELQAAIHYAVSQNVVVVAAAGNTSDTCKQNNQPDPNKPQSIVSPPWFSDDVLSVAAIDDTGSVASFSMNGPWVSVAAPGTKITSLDPSKGTDQLANQVVENDKQQDIQGTSFAAPYVAGLVALVRAQFPTLDARQVMQRIEATAQHPGAPGGHDNYIGYGVVNPVAALTSVVPQEDGIPVAQAKQPALGLPPAANKNWTPIIVALAGTGGGLLVLLITLFVMHTIRRNRTT